MKDTRSKIHDEINITPLTDIFLVLLIIMMVVAPFIMQRQLTISLDVANTEGSTEETTDESESLTVDIKADGTFMIEDVVILKDELTERLRAETQAKPASIVYISSAPDASFEYLAQAMDAAESAGAKNVTVIDASSEGEEDKTNETPAADSKQ